MPGQEREKRKVLRRCILKTESDCEDVTWSGRSFCVGAGDWERPLKAAFHYSSQLQTWLKTWSQAGRKPAANLLKTGFFYIPFVQHAREPANSACCGSQTAGFRQKQSKAGRKRVANPHELVENLATNLVENQVCSQVFAAGQNNGMRPLPTVRRTQNLDDERKQKTVYCSRRLDVMSATRSTNLF